MQRRFGYTLPRNYSNNFTHSEFCLLLNEFRGFVGQYSSQALFINQKGGINIL